MIQVYSKNIADVLSDSSGPKRILFNMFSESQLFQFIKCASLANKMVLFSQLLRSIPKQIPASQCNYSVASIKEPIERHKVIIDIHNSKYSGTNPYRDIFEQFIQGI